MLALALGKTLAEIESLSHEELSRWQRFYAVEPFGLIRDDMRSAIVATAATQPHIRKRVRVEDFMPKFRRPTAAQSQKELSANLVTILEMAKRAGSRKNIGEPDGGGRRLRERDEAG